MPTWLTVIMIVLVAVALSADLRRNTAEDLTGAVGNDELPTATPNLQIRPNVRDPLENGHRGAVPRPLNVRRSGRDVRKRR